LQVLFIQFVDHSTNKPIKIQFPVNEKEWIGPISIKKPIRYFLM